MVIIPRDLFEDPEELRKLRGLLEGYCRKMGLLKEEAENLVGDMIFNVLDRKFESKEHLTKYLFQSVHNRSISYHQKQRPTISLDQNPEYKRLLIPEEEIPVNNLIYNSVPRGIVNCFRNLPKTYKLTAYKFFWEGKTDQEIANETGVSRATARSRVRRARIILKQQLKDHASTREFVKEKTSEGIMLSLIDSINKNSKEKEINARLG